MKFFVAVALLICNLSQTIAHELPGNRATLVLREGHLSLTLLVDYTRVLHQVLAPQRPFQEFVMLYAAMSPVAFQSQLVQAQRNLQTGTQLRLQGKKSASFTQWTWPPTASVQHQFQQHTMQTMVAPADHGHAAQSEIRAQVQTNKPEAFNAVTLQLPPEFQQVLVVSYQPRQTWVKPGTASTMIRF